MKGISGLVLLIVSFCGIGRVSYAQAVSRTVDTTLSPSAREALRKDSADKLSERRVMQQSIKLKPKGPKPIKHEFSGGVRINTDGYSIYTDLGTVKAKNPKTADMFYNVRLWQLEFTEKKDPSQEKLVVDGSAGTGSGKYFYGKINNFYALKLGYGISKRIAGKPDPGAVSIHWLNLLGVSLGLLKPYYLNVFSDPNAIKYSDATKSEFVDQNIIMGSAGFSKGLSEIKFIPGGHFKSALHFDFAANRKSILGAEVGVNIEYYSQDVPIMLTQKSLPYFADLYMAVQFGKRW